MDLHQEAAILATRQYGREVASARRLAALWLERDAKLGGERAEEAVGERQSR